MTQKFEIIEINNLTVLFTSGRIDRANIPQGHYAYDLRHDDDDSSVPTTIEAEVTVNHFGTILTQEKIPMTHSDYTPIDDINFLGEEQEVEMA